MGVKGAEATKIKTLAKSTNALFFFFFFFTVTSTYTS